MCVGGGGGRRYMVKSLFLPVNFAVNLELL